MDDVLKAVLSQANADQNQHYPPRIFEQHFNIATKWLLDECAKAYPENDDVISVIMPYLKTEKIPVKNGLIPFPELFRRKVSMSIYVDLSCKEACDVPESDITDTEASEARAKAASISKKVTFKQQTEWDGLIQHPYKKPTLKKPIACVFEGEGIRIFPHNVPSVELRFVLQPSLCKYGYDRNLDDTFTYNKSKTKESLWNDTAYTYLVKGVSSLYAIWVRDPEMKAGIDSLKSIGLF